MAKRDTIAEHNADILARLEASDTFIKSLTTEKPAKDPTLTGEPREPAKPRRARKPADTE